MSDPKALTNIVESITRGKGSWSLTMQSGKAMLAAGAPTAIEAAGGVIVAIGLGRDELTRLRQAVDEALTILNSPN